MEESRWVSLIKSISWRVFGTASTMLIVFLMTHQLDTSLYVGVFEMVTKITLFYLHERFWIWLR